MDSSRIPLLQPIFLQDHLILIFRHKYLLGFGKTPAVPMQSHPLTPCNTSAPSFSVQGWNKPPDVRLVSSSIPLTCLQHLPGLSHHLLDLFLLLHHWQLHGEGTSGGGGYKEEAPGMVRSTTQHPSGKATAERMIHFSCFYSQSAAPKQFSAQWLRVFWCECQARLGCRAQLTDTQPTGAPADRLQPAHPNLFNPQTTQHHTIPSHFRWPQPPKALSFISHAKRAKHRVLIQHFSTKKRKKNPNPAAAFELSQEIASGEAQLGDGFVQGTIGKWDSLKRGNICLPARDKALRGEKFNSILTISQRFHCESQQQAQSSRSTRVALLKLSWEDSDPSHPVWMGNLASPTFLPAGLLLLDFNGELKYPGCTPGKAHGYGALIFSLKYSREARSWDTRSYCTGWESSSGRAGTRRAGTRNQEGWNLEAGGLEAGGLEAGTRRAGSRAAASCSALSVSLSKRSPGATSSKALCE